MPDVHRNIAAPTRQLLLAAHDKPKRAAVVWILEQAGHLVNLVSDGTKAVQAIIRRTYDVALTGVRLRNIDGADTTAAIRDLPGAHTLTTSYAIVGALKLSNAVNVILVFARSGDMDGAISRREVPCKDSDCAYKAL